MLGDDVASSMTQISTQVVGKATEVFLEFLKIMLERDRQRKDGEKSVELSGGKNTYTRLKKGGEVEMLPNFSKEDYKAFLSKAKAMDIPVATIKEDSKNDTVSLFYLKSDKDVVTSIVQDLVKNKLDAPEQTQKMVSIEKNQVEAFQVYCSNHDIPVNFLENKDGVKCIFDVQHEKSIEKAFEKFKEVQERLDKVSVNVIDDNGTPKITVSDSKINRKIALTFTNKANFEKVLREHLGYSDVMAVQTSNALVSKLSKGQLNYYLNGSRQLEQMDFYEKNIKFEDESFLNEPFSFTKLKLKDDVSRLTITDGEGKFVVLSENDKSRENVENAIRQHLGVENSETLKAMLSKVERIGFVDPPTLTKYQNYAIERDTQNTFSVSLGAVSVNCNLKDVATSKKSLMDTFGMNEKKAEKILNKAKKQSVSVNLIRKAKKSQSENHKDVVKHKKKDRGARQ
jgi:hypothetical protein